jgi:hypothetical protein
MRTAHPQQDEILAREAAHQVWYEAEDTEFVTELRNEVFAKAFVDELADLLRKAPAATRKVMRGAAGAAESMNVAQFQGLIECVQNADDVRATDVRLALRAVGDERQLLIVHNGQPVTSIHVLGMALPFMTTKTDRDDQRGRFGIGLKTLKRIAHNVAIHSAPYHFSGDQVSFGWMEPELALPGFYNPATDTLLALTLKDEVDERDLLDWFDQWQDDGLIFLASVRCFRFCTVDGQTLSERMMNVAPWADVPANASGRLTGLQSRRVQGAGQQAWTVWRGTSVVPAHLAPAHKTRSATTVVSLAVSDQASHGGVYIGFKTRIPCEMLFSVDAQFDPGTSRESMIENAWNQWLITECGILLSEVALAVLKTSPQIAWYLLPLPDESVGAKGDQWLGRNFAQAFGKVRDAIRTSGLLSVDGSMVGLQELAFAAARMEHLLTSVDIVALRPDKQALPPAACDDAGRWRTVLQELDISVILDTWDVMRGFQSRIFGNKESEWWVSAGRVIIEDLGDDEETAPFGYPFLLSDTSEPVDCHPPNTTGRILILGAEVSPFAMHWQLYQRLHLAYTSGEDASVVMKWLGREAAFALNVSAASDLGAFAEIYGSNPIEITAERLREVRDRFDEIQADKANELGPQVGAALLLEGFAFEKARKISKLVSPTNAYLSKTLDGEHAYWPVAAGTTSGLDWISSRYDEQLKASTRGTRRRSADGIVSRGARKFLMLLGAETAPRLLRTGLQVGGVGTRQHELRGRNANQVPEDLESADLNRVLEAILSSKKEARTRGPALLRTLSRSWERVFQQRCMVPSQLKARTLTHPRGSVTSKWLLNLRETPWVPVGRGTSTTTPTSAVLRSPATIDTYDTSALAFNIELEDISPQMAVALGMITAVRVSDLVRQLRKMRDSQELVTADRALGIYRAIARQIPANANFQARVGDIVLSELRAAFNEGAGLVLTGTWRRATEVWRGKDIFRRPDRFVQTAQGLPSLWSALNINKPRITDCVQELRHLASGPTDVDARSMLIDIYNYMDGLISDLSPEKSVKAKLRLVPLVCNSEWTNKRPIYYIENFGLRQELVRTKPGIKFWAPPCDTRSLLHLIPLLGITNAAPALAVVDDREAAYLRGERLHKRFSKAVTCLSDELARSDAETHSRLSMGWEQLKALPLYVYEDSVKVRWTDMTIPGSSGEVRLEALLLDDQGELHICEQSLERREQGGRVVAQLFPADTRHWIEAEWFAAWHKSRDEEPEGIRLAPDLAARRKTMQDQADDINLKGRKKGEVKVKPPAAKSVNAPPPRTLKNRVGVMGNAVVQEGKAPNPNSSVAPNRKTTLHDTAPTPRPRGEGAPPAATAYSTQDLEDRGWALVVHALNDFDDPRLIDFRNRHGVGADGAFDWKTFVELKATGREPQSSIEMSTAEYERAKERGADYILALASGLEDGMRDEVRLIFDPVEVVTMKPVSGMRLTRLIEAPCVHIPFAPALDEDSISPEE